MDEPEDPQRHHTLVATLILLGTVGISGAAAWLYFRSREPATDARTRARLQPRRGAGA